MVMADIFRESVRAKMGTLARIRPSSPAPDSSRSHKDSPSSVSASLADQRARDWFERSEVFLLFFWYRFCFWKKKRERADVKSTPARAE
jgi:hypothetical protein